MKRFAYVEYLNGDTDAIEADYAVKQHDSNIVTFYLKNGNVSSEVVAMYNMDNIIGWGFDDSGEVGDEIGEEECNGCPNSYMMGIVDCWHYLEYMLMNTITIPKIKSDLKKFFNDNDPVAAVIDFYEEEDEEDED